MQHLFILVLATLAITGCASKKIVEVREPSSFESGCEAEGTCIGQSVIGYFEKTGFGPVPYVGRIKSVEAGVYEIDNDTPCASGRCTIKTKQVFKEVKCMDGVCSGERAVDATGKEFEIRMVFSNGTVMADQGNVDFKTFLKSKDLFNECNCLGGACRYDMVTTPAGKRIEIDRLYRNGRVGATTSKVEYNLKELGFPSECTSETPCSCSNSKFN